MCKVTLAGHTKYHNIGAQQVKGRETEGKQGWAMHLTGKSVMKYELSKNLFPAVYKSLIKHVRPERSFLSKGQVGKHGVRRITNLN